MPPEKIRITTKPCTLCSETGEVEVDAQGYHRWAFDRVHIQDALPMESADVREQLLTGTHPKCWDKMFPPEAYDNEED